MCRLRVTHSVTITILSIGELIGLGEPKRSETSVDNVWILNAASV